MNLSTSIAALPGIGSYYVHLFNKLNINTVEDLINFYPFRYDDFSQTANALETKEGEKVTLKGELWSIQSIYTRTKKVMIKGIFNDGTSPIEITWFNQPWLTSQLKVGDKLQISGKITKFKNKLTMVSPVWEKLASLDIESATDQDNQSIHTGRLVPVYPETEGISSKFIRTRISRILPEVEQFITDPMPEEIREEMLTLPEAVKQIHFPDDYPSASKARERLAFDELFYMQLMSQKLRGEWKNKPLIKPLTIDQKKINKLLKSLPFELTDAQKKVIEEVIQDLQKEQPINRLVQGEVGSGKTVVAAIIAYIVYLNKLKVFYMAPTEILAFQHYNTFKKLLEPHGVEIGIYTGSRKYTKSAEFRVKSAELKTKKTHNSKLITLNSPHVIIGTHALLSDTLQAEDVGLVIIDEQQRFGVEQRSVLRQKAKIPHFLTMTATPIPRTVALTLYGDLDLSIIDKLPSGRQEIKTHVVPHKKRQDAYEFMRQKVKEGDQIYIITPLIDESEILVSLKSAIKEFETLQKNIFPDLKLGLLHGRLKPAEKDKILNDFKDKKTDILVSTTVIEVGVDVPNATIMVIENAERFGLAQLHQLRGRVGRGEKQSFCFLFPGVEDSNTVNRLKNLEKINDGLKLAELDLKIRGSGEIFGKKQSGRFELKIASFSDLPMIEKTRSAAQELLLQDPELDKHPQIKAKLANLAHVMPD